MPTMDRRRFLQTAAMAAPFLPKEKSAAKRPPNVILILTDDQGWYE